MTGGQRRQAGGMVLIAVLWMVAALSIVVTGMTQSVREEARMMSLARQRVVAGGLGDAAIHLVLQQMAVAGPRALTRLTYVETQYQGTPIRVSVMPLNGLIDINQAPSPLLAALYTVAGGLPKEAAIALAQATLEVRTRRTPQGQAERFAAPEDLLRVPGIGYDLYARLSRLITADAQGSGKVNPMAAPVDVLAVLAGGNLATAARIAAGRDAGQEGVDTTTLEAGFTEATTGRRFRIDARVPLPDGAWLHVSRSVDMSGSSRDALPWRTFHTEHGFEPVPGKNS